MSYSEKPGFGFRTEPDPESLAYIRSKGWKPAFSYKDVWGDEHAFAFTVAKATQMDVLRTIREALEKAKADGVPLATFARDLKPKLVELGWWGEGEVPDPASGGRDRPGQLGSPRRLRTIYQANMRTAAAHGQWQRIERNKETLPYLLYELGPSERHRPEHAAKKGLILPVDDPFWRAWMPPNGWGCKCRVRQLSEAEVRRRGLTVGTAPVVPTRAWRNERRGETVQVPAGIDPGWDNNPGLARRENLDRFAVDKLREAPPDLARAAIADMVASPRFADWLDRPAGAFPVARVSDDVAAAIGAANPVVTMSAAAIPERAGELALSDFRALPDLGANPELIVQDGGKRIAVIRRDGQPFLVELDAPAAGAAIGVTGFRRATDADLRRLAAGEVLFRRG